MTKIRKAFYFLPFLFLSLAVSGQLNFGAQAEEIALPSVNGDTLRLSSLKGKIVLLDFWASWCGPCRATNKQLVKLYPKFKEKGFEIYSISLDINKQSWKRAIQKDKISWLQVNDRGDFDAATAIKWHIDAIPTSYLIDREGKLIAMDLMPKELEKMLKDIIGD